MTTVNETIRPQFDPELEPIKNGDDDCTQAEAHRILARAHAVASAAAVEDQDDNLVRRHLTAGRFHARAAHRAAKSEA